jgi:hypothetical protein
VTTAVVEDHPVTAHPSGDHTMRVRDLATTRRTRWVSLAD